LRGGSQQLLRLRFESLAVHHAELVFDALSERSLYSFMPANPPASRRELATEFARLALGSNSAAVWLNWITLSLRTNEPVGTLQATIHPNRDAHIAYSIFRRHWRRCFARESVTLMLHELQRYHAVTKAVALIDTRKYPSIRLIESLGFERVGIRYDADFFKGGTSDEFRYERSLVIR